MFKKFLVAVAAMLTALAFCLPAAAEVKTFDRISIDVPDGWHINYEDGGLFLATVSPSPAMVVVIIHPLDGYSFDKAALELSEGFDVNAVPQKDADGNYSFSYKEPNSKLDLKIVITQENGKLKFIGFGGNHPDLEKIINSVKEK